MTHPFLIRAALIAATSALLLLGLVGCGEPQSAVASAHAPRISKSSFDIGVPDKYRRKRVYTQFADSHGVYLVSNHGMLVALAAECTNDGHRPARVRYQPEVGIYRCAVCGAKFTRDGLNRGKSQTDRPLERCRIRHSGKIYDRDTTLIVDPGKRFRQEDQEWSKHTSFFPLEEIVRTREQRREIARQQEKARTAEQPPLRWRE
ncbi:MAG: hypothetical protein AAF333_13950 [Planctomycetota bacterium]